MRTRRSLALLVLALSVVLPVAATASTRDASFTDPTGDAGTAPDVTTVTVTNTPEGQITITAAIPSLPTLAANQFVDVLIDSDNNPTTGGFGIGADYAYEIGGSGATAFLKLSGETQDPNVPRTTLSASYTDSALRFSINRSELGNTSAFAVLVFTGALDATGENLAGLDRAPDNGFFGYQLVLPPPPVVLTAGVPIAVPGRPVSGQPFTVSLPVTRSDTQGPLTGGGIVSCTAQVGTRPIAARGRFAGGLPRCAMKVPPKSTGKTLRGTMTVVFQGKGVKKRFAFRVI